MNKTIVHRLAEGESSNEYLVPKHSSLTLILISVGLQHVDAHVRVRLKGIGAHATIVGVVLAEGNANIKLNTLQQHEAPDTTSNLLVKSALRGTARCIVDGGIRVEKKAQKTDAYQRNENLLLSERAYAESKPSLEILANDVRCTHGATVGPISEEELWFLATRGIARSKAEGLIVEGFFRSALDLVGDETAKRGILRSVWEHLPK